MKSALRSIPLLLLFSSAHASEVLAPAGAAEEVPPKVESTSPVIDQEFIKRIAVARPRRYSMVSRECWDGGAPADRIPSWALSRMVVRVPDGTPQRVYRAPSANRCSPDFGGN